ncbi:MAG TPA: response regulator [Candidatus Limnocylindria bacterium]|jgi:CheY-like chemotaxis protein|nr:response regulator [Candidatus Limnocylindria bacterium]
MKREAGIDVLLVEDSECDAELAMRTLRRQQLADRVVHVVDGQMALDWFFGPSGGAHHPKLVLLDLKLPKADGLEVLGALRSHESTRSLPVVVLTSSMEDRDLRNCYRLGANSYVVKPTSFDDYCAAVAELTRYWLLLNKKD